MSAAPPTDAKQASKDAGIYTYSRLAGSLFTLLALALGSRLYHTPEFAYVSALLLLYESAVALGSFGLADAVFYLIGSSTGRAHLVVRQTSLLLLVVAVPVIAVVCTMGAFMQREIPLGPALPWLAATILVELPTQPAVNQLLAVGRAGLASALYVGFAAFRPVAVLLPALAGVDITWIPIVLTAAALARLGVHVWILRTAFPMAEGHTRRDWLEGSALRGILWFALPAGMAALAGRLNPQIDKYVVQLVRGNEDFVLYTAAAWELPLVTLVPYAIGAVMQVRYTRLFHEQRHDELRALWLQTVRKTALVVLPLTMMLIALAEEAVTLVAGAKYAAAAPLFQIFTMTMLQRVASYGSMLQSIDETRALYVTSSLLLVTNLALTYPFTILFGFPGAAIASVVATVPPLIFTLRRISVKLRTTIGGVMPWGFYVATLALACGVALGIWLLAGSLPLAAGPRLGVCAVAYIAAFFVLGRILRLIGDGDVAYLTEWLTLKMLKR